ncbi:MAG TPA: hypothetical protein VF433_11620 [Cellvibrio sp.]
MTERTKSDNGEEKPVTRVMTVYYERLSDEEEEALMEAVESITCLGNSDEEEHDCRLHCIVWNDLVEEEG